MPALRTSSNSISSLSSSRSRRTRWIRYSVVVHGSSGVSAPNRTRRRCFFPSVFPVSVKEKGGHLRLRSSSHIPRDRQLVRLYRVEGSNSGVASHLRNHPWPSPVLSHMIFRIPASALCLRGVLRDGPEGRARAVGEARVPIMARFRAAVRKESALKGSPKGGRVKRRDSGERSLSSTSSDLGAASSG